MPRMSFNQRLKQARVTANLTQSELAKLCGVAQASYCRWETDETLPAVDKGLVLERVLNTSLHWLLYGEGEGPVNTETDNWVGNGTSSRIRNRALKEAVRLTENMMREAEKTLPNELLALLQMPTAESLPSFEKNLRALLVRFSPPGVESSEPARLPEAAAE
jgi:transcriptional regulator with XRE-family HTH domain